MNRVSVAGGRGRGLGFSSMVGGLDRGLLDHGGGLLSGLYEVAVDPVLLGDGLASVGLLVDLGRAGGLDAHGQVLEQAAYHGLLGHLLPVIHPGAATSGAAALPHGLDLGAAEHFELNATVLEGGDGIDIIAKIENRTGIDNIEDICEECDGIMIGRGDLGVEVPFTELPALQKYIITKCRLLGKRVITATEMLESMITNPRPTRAEISDVANAVYDGTSAVMLSGESAAGKYPVETVRTMAEIVEETEKHIHYAKRFRNNDFKIKNRVDAISHATCGMAIDINAKAIVVASISGMTVRMVSRFRAPTDIIGMATNRAVWYKLALSWGVMPVLSEKFDSTDVLFYHAQKVAKDALNLKPGDNIIMTGGAINGKSGNTNLIKIETIE